MKQLELIESLERKFNDIDNKIKTMLDKKQQQLLSKVDFIKALDISIPEYDLLQDYNNIRELSEQDIKRIIALNDLLQQKYKYIDLLNEKLILTCSDWKVVNKNSITYILNKDKTKQEKSNVIINVYFDDKSNKIMLDKITGEPNNE